MGQQKTTIYSNKSEKYEEAKTLWVNNGTEKDNKHHQHHNSERIKCNTWIRLSLHTVAMDWVLRDRADNFHIVESYIQMQYTHICTFVERTSITKKWSLYIND